MAGSETNNKQQIQVDYNVEINNIVENINAQLNSVINSVSIDDDDMKETFKTKIKENVNVEEKVRKYIELNITNLPINMAETIIDAIKELIMDLFDGKEEINILEALEKHTFDVSEIEAQINKIKGKVRVNQKDLKNVMKTQLSKSSTKIHHEKKWGQHEPSEAERKRRKETDGYNPRKTAAPTPPAAEPTEPPVVGGRRTRRRKNKKRRKTNKKRKRVKKSRKNKKQKRRKSKKRSRRR